MIKGFHFPVVGLRFFYVSYSNLQECSSSVLYYNNFRVFKPFGENVYEVAKCLSKKHTINVFFWGKGTVILFTFFINLTLKAFSLNKNISSYTIFIFIFKYLVYW